MSDYLKIQCVRCDTTFFDGELDDVIWDEIYSMVDGHHCKAEVAQND